MTEQSLDDDPEDIDGYQYDDPGELYQGERIKQLLAARRRFREGRLGAREQMYERGHDYTRADYRDVCAQLALDYLSELEPLIRRTDSNLLERVIETEPREIKDPNDDITTTDPPNVTVGKLLDTGGDVETKYQYEYFDTYDNTSKKDTETVRVTIDDNTSQKLVRLCDDFLESIMPVEIDQGTETAEFDYSTIEDIEL
jgi:hypothetical protein